jgi:hypothetical protein
VGAYTREGAQLVVVAEGETPAVAANGAYATLPEAAAAQTYALTAPVPTGIEAIDALTAGKAEIYDLNGRKLNSLRKGINIVNGVKVLVK